MDQIRRKRCKLWKIISNCSAQTQTRIGLLEEIPRSGSDSLPLLLGHLGVRAPYATRRKRRYEANQVWMNTTFISQGPQSWGKLAVETWRVKTELIIITILHIIIITTSILNLGFKTIAPKILAHTKCINKYWKYTQIFAATKSSKNSLQKQAKLIAKIKLGRTYCKIIKILALA
jgi:hypothetical protein